MVASVAQLLNQVCFLILCVVPASSVTNCAAFQMATDLLYFTYQLLSVYVLIVRTSQFVPPAHRRLTHFILYSLLIVSTMLTFHSSISKHTIITDNRCIALYTHWSNAIGKAILCTLYVCLLLAFVVPITIALQDTKSKYKSTFQKIAIRGGIRISIAIIGFLTALILSMFGIFGSEIYIEFTLENYCGITASTFIIHQSDSNLSGSSSKKKPSASAERELSTGIPDVTYDTNIWQLKGNKAVHSGESNVKTGMTSFNISETNGLDTFLSLEFKDLESDHINFIDYQSTNGSNTTINP
ncbi:hypothetical protein HDV02_005392 [Globomyces sp. JEL0801]|nr:hypothetical protein HDV02_005392 [Globomyces sp. JEL0801]